MRPPRRAAAEDGPAPSIDKDSSGVPLNRAAGDETVPDKSRVPLSPEELEQQAAAKLLEVRVRHDLLLAVHNRVTPL